MAAFVDLFHVVLVVSAAVVVVVVVAVVVGVFAIVSRALAAVLMLMTHLAKLLQSNASLPGYCLIFVFKSFRKLPNFHIPQISILTNSLTPLTLSLSFSFILSHSLIISLHPSLYLYLAHSLAFSIILF